MEKTKFKVNEKIRNYLKSKGISQTHLARNMGMPVSTINKMLKNNREISVDELKNIADILEVNTNIFFED